MAAMTPEQAQKLYAEKDRRYSNPSYGDLSHLYEPQQSQQEYGYGSSGPQMSKPGSSTWLEQNNTALQSMNPEQRQQYQQAASRQFQQQMTSPPPAVAQPVGRPQSQPWAQQEAQRQPLVPPTPQRPAAPPRPQATQPQQRQPLIPPKPATPAQPKYGQPPAYNPAAAASYENRSMPRGMTDAKPTQTPSGNQAGPGQPVRATPPGQVSMGEPPERTEATTDPRANPATRRADTT